MTERIRTPEQILAEFGGREFAWRRIQAMNPSQHARTRRERSTPWLAELRGERTRTRPDPWRDSELRTD